MYYAENPDAAHDIHELRVDLLGQKMTFLTDAGVFSKKMVDFGSQLLLKCLEVNQGETVLDVGCGYGPLGLSLAKQIVDALKGSISVKDNKPNGTIFEVKLAISTPSKRKEINKKLRFIEGFYLNFFLIKVR